MTPGWIEMLRVFGRIGVTSFGGPAAQIALMHRELVQERPWLTEAQYLRALSFCMLLPGPEAMQLATYSGWRLRGLGGGLLAGLLFVVPGALVIALLAWAYLSFGDLPLVKAGFLGVQAAVVVIVVAALRKVWTKALTVPAAALVAALTFLALFGFGLPFPLIIVAAGLIGAAFLRPAEVESAGMPRPALPLRPVLIGAVLWSAPILLAWVAGSGFLVELGLFFSRLAVVSFGGAYAVLAYMTQTVVQEQGWITTAQMLDALGLAETTPGPLILVTQFVGLLAGAAQGGAGLAVLAGLMTLWVTFVPCFIWIFTGAPYIDWLAGQARLQGALAGITAAVVGVIANLSLWFALQVFFAEVRDGPLALPLPVWSSLNPWSLAIAVVAGGLLFGGRLGLLGTLGASAAAGVLLHLTGAV